MTSPCNTATVNQCIPSTHPFKLHNPLNQKAHLFWLLCPLCNLLQSFEALNQRAVSVVIDPVQSVKGKVVIDAFRLISPQVGGARVGCGCADPWPEPAASARAASSKKRRELHC